MAMRKVLLLALMLLALIKSILTSCLQLKKSWYNSGMESTIWLRIGSRSGPRSGDKIPTAVPSPGTWEQDRGQFINSTNTQIVWRRGRWEKRFDKVMKRDTLCFYFYGNGFADYECTQAIVPETDFAGVE